MITDESTGWTEPTIIINDELLNFAQAMSIRVAIGSMLISLSDPNYCNEIGSVLASNYKDRLSEVEILMHRK